MGHDCQMGVVSGLGRGRYFDELGQRLWLVEPHEIWTESEGKGTKRLHKQTTANIKRQQMTYAAKINFN